jgi:hypothetical protein
VSDVVWTGDLNAIEVVALARLAANSALVPPPHLRTSLQRRGWLISDTGRTTLSPHARSLIGRLVATGSYVSSAAAR